MDQPKHTYRINFPDGKHRDIKVDDTSYRFRSIMGKNEVNLKFSLPEYVEFKSGCWVEYKGIRYYCLNEPSITRHATHNCEYGIVFEPHAGKLRLWTLRNFAIMAHNDEFKFSAALTPREAVNLIVETLNDRDPEQGWEVGECIESDHKLFDFNNTKLNVALSMMASEFNTEWEIIHKTIHLRKVEHGRETPLPLSYGKGNGFVPGVGVISTGKQSQFEILLVQGGNRNLDRSRYGHYVNGNWQPFPRWRMPANARLEHNGVIYQTDENGREVTIADKPLTTKVDLTLDLTEMYPHRVGRVTHVFTVDADRRFVDFADRDFVFPDGEVYQGIPENLDFSQYRIPGETATITFQSGMLAGRAFDILQDANVLNGYIHSERRFKLVPRTDDGLEMPKAPFMPAVGDRYAVFGVMLPNAFINDPATETGVEWDIFREACRFFDEQNNIPFKFTGTIDPNWARQDWANRGGILEPGWFVRFSDKDFKPEGYDIRITGMRDYANDEFSAVLELSNDVVVSGLSTEFARIAGERQRLDRERAGLQDLNSRTFADAIRTAQMLIDAGLEGFSESIQPITIQTMQALIGAAELQFTITRDDGHRAQQFWDNQQRRLICEAGELVHHTLGIDYITDEHDDSKLDRWNIGAFQSPQNLNQNGYYLYARCSKRSAGAGIMREGTYRISEQPLPMDDGGYFNFLVGILNPEVGDNRSFAPMNGFTLIEPGRIVVNRLQSSDFNPETGQGAALDLEAKKLIFGDQAEIITEKLTVKPPTSGEGVSMFLQGLLGVTEGGTDIENIVAAISGRSDDDVGIVLHRDEDGNTDAYRRAVDFLSKNMADRRPNFTLAKDGRVYANNANIRGIIEAIEGRFGNLSINANGDIVMNTDGEDNFAIINDFIPPLDQIRSSLWRNVPLVGGTAGLGLRQGSNVATYQWGIISGIPRIVANLHEMDSRREIRFSLETGQQCRISTDFNVMIQFDNSVIRRLRTADRIPVLEYFANGVSGNLIQIPFVSRTDPAWDGTALHTSGRATASFAFTAPVTGTYILTWITSTDLAPHQLTPQIGNAGYMIGTSNPQQVRLQTFLGATVQIDSPYNSKKIFRDGDYTFFSTNNYFYHSESQGFEVRAGMFGIRVTVNGLQRWNQQGETWGPL